MPQQTRQLDAIMFTDFVGYTAMMGKDSNKALELVRLNPPQNLLKARLPDEAGDSEYDDKTEF